MSQSEQKIVQYLNEAHATEVGLVRVLQSQIAMTPRGTYRTGAREAPSRDARRTPSACRRGWRELGPSGNPLLAGIGFIEGVAEPGAGAVEDAARPRARGAAARRRCSRTPRTPAPPRRWRSRPTPRSSTWPGRSATTTTAELAASIRADEEQMLDRVLRELPKLARRGRAFRGRRQAVLRRHRDRRGRRRARDGRRRPSRPRAARRRAPSARLARPARCRASRGPRARSRARSRPRGSGDRAATTSSPPRRSPASSPGSRRSTWPRSTPTSASTTNRTTVLSRISALQGDEPWPGYDELTVDEIQCRPRRATTTAPSEVRRYERAHKNRAGVLKRRRARARQRLAPGSEASPTSGTPRPAGRGGRPSRTGRRGAPAASCAPFQAFALALRFVVLRPLPATPVGSSDRPAASRSLRAISAISSGA